MHITPTGQSGIAEAERISLQDFPVAEMNQRQVARGEKRALSDALDDQNHPRAQHRQVAIVSLQGFDRCVVIAGNGDQSLSGLHFVTLYRLPRGRR
jgi:hypothetical protein